jgi:hypothetical protein
MMPRQYSCRSIPSGEGAIDVEIEHTVGRNIGGALGHQFGKRSGHENSPKCRRAFRPFPIVAQLMQSTQRGKFFPAIFRKYHLMLDFPGESAIMPKIYRILSGIDIVRHNGEVRGTFAR